MSKITKYRKCTIRKDLLEKKAKIPIGAKYYTGESPLPYRWRDNNNTFEVLYKGKWEEACSIDFDF